MDLDSGIIAALLSSGREGLKQVSDSGIDLSMLQGDNVRNSYLFLREHIREHGEMPSKDYFLTKNDIILPTRVDSVSVYIEEIKKRHLWNLQVSFVHDFGKLVNDRKVGEAQNRIDSYQKEVRQANVLNEKAQSIWSFSDQIIASYEDAKAGKMGIKTPWPSLNKATRGWDNGDFVLFVSKSGVGKTFLLLMLARQAWMDGFNILFLSPEMRKQKLAARHVCLHLGFSYTDFIEGRFGIFGEEKFFDQVRKLKTEEGFDIIGKGPRFTMPFIEDNIAVYKPDIVFIDGLYLVKSNQSSSRSENLASVVEEIMMLAGHYDIPFVCSTQFNREVKSNDLSTLSADSIGLTDNMRWSCDIVYAIAQTDDMLADKEMMLRPLKLRESGNRNDIYLRWDFDRMLFGELGSNNDFHDEDFQKYAEKGSDSQGTINHDFSDDTTLPF